MKKTLILLLFLPLLAFPQPKQAPFATIRDGKVFYYIPRGEPRLLPLYKPGFVEILQTITPMMKSIQQVNEGLKEGLERFRGFRLTTSEKQEYLEMLACFILLNYDNTARIDTVFTYNARELQKDKDKTISDNAGLVIRLYEMYKK